MWGCMFSVYPFLLWWLRKYIYTLSYYHHQIGSMNYYPLSRVRSWNNGVCCMSFYILRLRIQTFKFVSSSTCPVYSWDVNFVILWQQKLFLENPDSKVHEANMGHIWGQQGPGGPNVSPMGFTIWESNQSYQRVKIFLLVAVDCPWIR